MKNPLLLYGLFVTGCYVGLFLIEAIILSFFLQLFFSDALISLTVALPLLLFVNPVITWIMCELIMKKK